MLTTRRAGIAATVIITAMFVAGLLAWPHLPEIMAIHWNASNVADGTVHKFLGVFSAPVIATALAALLFWLPSADPLRRSFKAFRREYDGLILLLLGFFLLMQAMVLAWNLGARFEFSRILAPGVGLLCYYLGSIMPRMERNHFMGIRTPWTLSSDRVWRATHRHAGYLFRISGVLASFGAVFHDYAFALILGPIVLTALWATIHSYLVYRKRL